MRNILTAEGIKIFDGFHVNRGVFFAKVRQSNIRRSLQISQMDIISSLSSNSFSSFSFRLSKFLIRRGYISSLISSSSGNCSLSEVTANSVRDWPLFCFCNRSRSMCIRANDCSSELHAAKKSVFSSSIPALLSCSTLSFGFFDIAESNN